MRPAYYGYFHGFTPLPEPAVESCLCATRLASSSRCGPMKTAWRWNSSLRTSRRSAPIRWPRSWSVSGGCRAWRRGWRAPPGGQTAGTRGIENRFRKPYGPGWALAGDAGYLKDPATGTGHRRRPHAVLPARGALDAALRGGDWETNLAAYQRTRDAALLPMYRFTLDATQLRDAPPEFLAWLRAATMSPHVCRQVITGCRQCSRPACRRTWRRWCARSRAISAPRPMWSRRW